MSRRGVTILVMAIFYVVQVLLLLYALSLGSPSLRGFDVAVTLALAATAGMVDIAVVRYLFKALERSQMAFALDMSEQLRQSLERYQAVLEEGNRETEELVRAIENELAQARSALADGHVGSMDEHLREGLEIASEVRRSPCSNAAVSAILDAKTRQCAASGVALNDAVDLPDELPIPDVELAAIFFNLIDNALHECEVLAEEDANVAGLQIDVRSMVEYEQLIVTVTNPCRSGVDVRKRAADRKQQTGSSHGLGTDVVRVIADSHQGLAAFDEKEGTFTASVMIPLPE